MSEPPGWFRTQRGRAEGRAPEPPAVAEPTPTDDGINDAEVNDDGVTDAEIVDRELLDGEAGGGRPGHGADDRVGSPVSLIVIEDPEGLLIDVEEVRPEASRESPPESLPEPPAPEPPALESPGPSVDVVRIPVVPTARSDRLRRRIMIVVVVVVVSLLLVVAVVEFVGRRVVQNEVGKEIRASGVAVEADVTIGRAWWTPSVTRALLTRTLDMVDVRLSSTDVVGVPAESLHWRLFDLGLSLSLRDPRVTVTSLGSGDVTVRIDPTSFGEMMGVPTDVRGGRLYLGGSDEPATVYVKRLDLVVEHPMLADLTGSDDVLFPVSDPYMLPCDPGLEMHDDVMVLGCSGSRIPGVLGRVLGGGSSDDPSSDEVDVEIYAPGPITEGD